MAHRDPSPRKTVPLAAGDEPRPHPTRPTITRRAFFCGVVVENSGYGHTLPPDVEELVADLGEPIDLEPDASNLPEDTDSIINSLKAGDKPHDSSALPDVINEFVSTEQSYVKRLRILKTDYADPLRTFARSKSTAIIPPYEAKTLFGNIDQLLPVNEAFLEDLEKMMRPDGLRTVGGIGDVALKHFKESRGFEHYKQYYSKREEAQAIFEKEMRKSSGFSAFIDRIKYSSSETKNRIGLRELLMDPVQRIPRYTLLFRTMIKFMAPDDPQRAKLLEADEIASKIAQAETDDQTKRAAILYSLGATIEDFPPILISNSRHFIDCIDVEDVVSEAILPSSASGASQGLGNLHCTLFLFDDKLVIVKRPGNGEKGGRALSGLSDLDKLGRSGMPLMGMKRSGMVCKGVVDVTDVTATDVGGTDFHLYLEAPPRDKGERWSNRPFRAFTTVNPPYGLDPTRLEAEKTRFLENLWTVQARFRTRENQSVILFAEDRNVETKGPRVTLARTYFNVYQRTAFLREERKTKVVVHIDHTGSADPLPYGARAPPFVCIQVRPMAGELSRYTVLSGDPTDEQEDDIVQTRCIPERIIHTIHQFGLFKFRTGNNSMPSTPTASRARVAKFGLDAISRNLFNALPGSAMGDIFGGSINGHRRSKTTASRTSTYTQSTSTADSSLSRSTRSRSISTITSATTMSLMEDDNPSSTHSGSGNSKTRSRSLSKAKKLIKRGKSPGGSGSEQDVSPKRAPSRLSPFALRGSGSRSPSVERGSEWDEEATLDARPTRTMDESERDLAARLDLARRNSRNQNETKYTRTPIEPPAEATIYEDELSHPARPASRTSRASRDLPDIPDGQSQRSVTPRPTTPSNYLLSTEARESSPRRARSTSRHSAERRPLGPRSPSPLPPAKLYVDTNVAPSRLEEEEDVDMDDMVANLPETPRRGRSGASPLPRSKRQPFEPVSNTDATPKATAALAAAAAEDAPVVEPLSIKKRTSVRTSGYQIQRSSPLLKPTNRLTASEKKVAPPKQSRIPVPAPHASGAAPSSSKVLEEAEQLFTTAEATKSDLDSAHRAVKRIKLEVDRARATTTPSSPAGEISRPSSPVKGLRNSPWTATTPPPHTREAQARMEEMQRLIGKRLGDNTSRARPLSMVASASLSHISDSTRSSGSSNADHDVVMNSIDDLATQAESDIIKSVKGHSQLLSGVKTLTTQLKEKSSELERTRLELQGARRQCEVVKSFLADCTAEKEIMYEAFNEELDAMFDDANLPEDEAWVAMTRDLRQTKEARNTLSKENSHLKRKLVEMELQNEEWGALLRAHGLLPSS
ncbi:hypothetical protein BXZ70DRAFT_1066217 [Cristinia sonorae]|uniref:DH domain-containing protein n=1 Tax=Cristinia sonorae TaxID=1940300 RepID=A0A8K0UJM6_9AGAR|nr:hypothetical protein BXZ70DRAFT_1066217 [Cristinia sonorae]